MISATAVSEEIIITIIKLYSYKSLRNFVAETIY